MKKGQDGYVNSKNLFKRIPDELPQVKESEESPAGSAMLAESRSGQTHNLTKRRAMRWTRGGGLVKSMGMQGG